MLVSSVTHSLDELLVLLRQLPDDDYAKPCPALSGASIGEHTRHVIEMFRCLLDNYDLGVVNYDKRARNHLMQTSAGFASAVIAAIRQDLRKANKNIALVQLVGGHEIRIESNYDRELLYNLEHCIHHQALIKVALKDCQGVSVDENFGVARSTIEYRRQCAQ